MPDPRGPISCPEAERAVLGAMLLDPTCLDAIAEILTAGDFYEPTHGQVFKAIMEINDAQRAVDAVSVRDWLRENASRPAGSDPAQLIVADLIAEVATAAHAETHARIIREKSRLRVLEAVAHTVLKDIQESSGSAEEVIDRVEQKFFEATQVSSIQQDIVSVREILCEVIKAASLAGSSGGFGGGLQTGYADLDFHLRGLRGGQLIIIAARPSVGKTSFALNLIRNICSGEGVTGALFTLEMRGLDITLNLLCSMSGVPRSTVEAGVMDSADQNAFYDAAEVLEKLPLIIEDRSPLSHLDVRHRSRRVKAKRGLGFVVIDYLQLLRGGPSHHESRQAEVALISRNLKSLALELDIPILALSQLNRASSERADQRPRMADLRESGSLEQDADAVLLIHRKDYAARQRGMAESQIPEEDRGRAEIIIAKNRNGPTGMLDLAFKPECFRFDSL